jgi:UDP-N-acetylmuramoyl-L-alanyl-D-glutamate--2,6-diaminopimelate ligase
VAVPRPTRLRSTPLRDLAALVDAGDPASQVAVTGVTLDSRAVLPGDLYAALPGARAHGADFAGQAAAAGAVAVLTDRTGVDRMTGAGVALPAVVVEQPRAVLGAVSARVLGTERLALRLVGITGTNGKTTTAYLVHSALTAMGRHAGLIGTVETRIGDERVGSVRTTPEAPELHAVLAVMAERGLDSCVMEVSSHALAQHRVDGVVYDVALFTNLSQDHLDFHRDMDDYFDAKASLFTPERARQGLVCVDDEWGRRLVERSGIPVQTLGRAAGADWRVAVDGNDPAAFRLTGPGVDLHLRSSLPGDFNVTNTAMAAAALVLLGERPSTVGAAVLTDPHVPGRMEAVPAPVGADAPRAVVDYAHTP